jgi:protoporphyrinogen oxidase
MERREGSWKVVALQDQALAARVVQGIVKALPDRTRPSRSKCVVNWKRFLALYRSFR